MKRESEIKSSKKRISKKTKVILAICFVAVAGSIAYYLKIKPDINYRPKKINNSKKHLINSLNRSIFKLTDNDKHKEVKIRKSSPFIKEARKSYSQRYNSDYSGSGIFAREIAEDLGLEYKNSGNPNSELVNDVLNKTNAKPTGYKNKVQHTYNNGGNGYRHFATPLYPNDVKQRVKEYIERNSELINAENEIYKCSKKQFKIKK